MPRSRLAWWQARMCLSFASRRNNQALCALRYIGKASVHPLPAMLGFIRTSSPGTVPVRLAELPECQLFRVYR